MVESSMISITPATHADRHRTGGADPLTGDVGINGLSVIRSEGILPTITPTWTTPASDLANITDGDRSTFATEAVDTVNGTDEEVIKIDLGALYTLRNIFYKIAVRAQFNNGVTVYCDVSPDDAAWTQTGTTSSPYNDTWQTLSGTTIPDIAFRYIRMRMIQTAGHNQYRYILHAIEAY